MKKGKKWTKEEENRLISLWDQQDWDMMCSTFGRTKVSIKQKAKRLGLPTINKYWTNEEEAYLEEHWGTVNIKTISKKLNRSINAIRLKGQELGLTRALWCLDEITLNQLAKAIQVDYKTVITWEEKYQFPVKKKSPTVKARYKVIGLEDFWEWSSKYRQLIDFSRVEKHILGKEPEWVEEKRRADSVKISRRSGYAVWTDADVKKLLYMVHQYKFTYTDIAKELTRSENAIKRKLYDLGVKARPVRKESNVRWTTEEEMELVSLYEKGFSYDYIGSVLGDMSENCVRNKLERMGYRSIRNVDKSA